jgi:exopolyphosphatase/guanosine-5'-triphosphate,3'-diphosphate pyrophosphatase
MPPIPRPDDGLEASLTAASARGPRPIVGASVDLGSNSVHLLVAVVAGHRLQPLVDESVFLGLGSAVGERGFLGRAARGELVDALLRYTDSARRLGATNVTFVGTEPIRRAADGGVIVHEVGRATGAPLHVLSHEEEAFLTIIGVTEGMPVTRETLVVDVGGGSSEFCIVDASGPPRAAGIRLGGARLTDRFVTHDPPTQNEIAEMRLAAVDAIRDAPGARPEEIVAVGGTASNLLKVLPAAALDRTLTHDRIVEALAILATEPAAVAAERHLINPTRARILPAGGVILEAILDRYGVDRIRVSEAGVREGTILAVDHAGAAWRDRLTALARGWLSPTAEGPL